MNILLSVGKRVEQTSITPKCGTYGSSFKLQIHTLKANLEFYHLSIRGIFFCSWSTMGELNSMFFYIILLGKKLKVRVIILLAL